MMVPCIAPYSSASPTCLLISTDALSKLGSEGKEVQNLFSAQQLSVGVN